MTKQIAATLTPFLWGLMLLTAGCSANHARLAPPVAVMTPALACPWLDGEHYRAPVKLSDASATAPLSPKNVVTGCAILRFRVAADGSVSSAALRAANPLNDGPGALTVLRNMRFQPARRLDTQFVIRLDMRRDSTGHVTVTTETRRHAPFFGDYS
jgi:hypothetical protein